MNRFIQILFIFILFFGCDSNKTSEISKKSLAKIKNTTVKDVKETQVPYTGESKSIHILVALCDNKYQGIVPVPKNLGNGQEPKSNLYWGAAYGIKTYFKRSKEWRFLKTKKVNDTILERVIFKHKKKDFYLIADAYDGQFIKSTTIDYLKSLSGIIKDTLKVNDKIIGINGNSKLVVYIGHDGLMDFDLENIYKNKDDQQRDAIMLACYSKSYFSSFIKEAKANPIVWSTGLMAPEAYTIHDALSGYVNHETDAQIRLRAAKAYSNYQKCGLRPAKNLLVNGW